VNLAARSFAWLSIMAPICNFHWQGPAGFVNLSLLLELELMGSLHETWCQNDENMLRTSS